MDRAILKSRAKDSLRAFYWTAFLACLIIAVLNYVYIDFDSNNSRKTKYWGADDSTNLNYYLQSDSTGRGTATVTEWPIGEPEWGNFTTYNQLTNSYRVIPFNPLLVLIVIGAIAFNLAWQLLVYNVFLVGQKKHFIEGAEGSYRLGSIVFLYKNKKWFSTSTKIFRMNVVIFLWSLLFIIPGIIKMYEYFMVPYILADDPDMPFKEAMAKSSQMTSGKKMDIFVLGLSFIGWYLLGLLACCVGVIFVAPYVEATFAQLYVELRDDPYSQANRAAIYSEP